MQQRRLGVVRVLRRVTAGYAVLQAFFAGAGALAGLGGSVGLGAVYGFGAISGCNAIAGIEDAELDPRAGSGSGGKGGGGDGGSGATGGSGGSGGSSVSELCQEYCDVVQKNCPVADDYAVYGSMKTCRNVCSFLPPGEPDAREGNSVECRLFNARAAGETLEPEVNCPIAGPTGNGVCGDPCEAYCMVLEGTCPDDYRDDCLAKCREVPDLGGFSISMDTGDSIQCRMYHLSSATVDPVSHCVHAAGIETCVRAP